MNFRNARLFTGKIILLLTLCLTAAEAFSQTADSTQHVISFKGSLSATNNGFSFIPSFSLGKPAAMRPACSDNLEILEDL